MDKACVESPRPGITRVPEACRTAFRPWRTAIRPPAQSVRHPSGTVSVMPPEWCPPSRRNRVRHGPVHAVDAWSSVALLREAVDGVDLRGQPHVLKGTRTSWSITPSVIPAHRNPEQSAHDPYPVGGLVCLYESVERFVFGALS